MVDLDSKVHFVNPAFCRLWDVAQPTDVLGHSIDDLCGAANADLLRHGLAGHGPWSGVLEFVRADGTALRIEATSAPNFDFANVFVGLVISFIGVPPAHA